MFGYLSNFNKLEPDIRWRFTFTIAFTLGVLGLIVLGLGSEGDGKFRRTMAALFLAAASGAVGAFLGFLFGIPRSQQGEPVPDPTTGEVRRSYSENTNLEQISDWLTKIIVGLTLVQFNAVVDMLKSISNAYGPAILNHSSAHAAAMAIIVYFFMASLLFVYLWTRIYVETLFRRQSVLAHYDLKKLISEREENIGSKDADAIRMTDEYLDEKSDPNSPKFDKLEEVVAKASHLSRTLIFDRAREHRKQAWDAQDAAQVAKVIPVFRGLIKAAPNEYHRNYGQLGYALVRAPDPDWDAARVALQKAIKLRGDDLQTSGTGLYEFNLAIALINLDGDFQADKASSAEAKKTIAALLDASKPVVSDLNEQVIQSWAKLNNYKI